MTRKKTWRILTMMQPQRLGVEVAIPYEVQHGGFSNLNSCTQAKKAVTRKALETMMIQCTKIKGQTMNPMDQPANRRGAIFSQNWWNTAPQLKYTAPWELCIRILAHPVIVFWTKLTPYKLDLWRNTKYRASSGDALTIHLTFTI